MFFSNFFKLHYLPGLACIWFILTFILTYFISVENGHVYPVFPFISDTGTIPPESCIFSQMLNLGAALMAVIVFVRYKQVKFAVTSENVSLNKLWNPIGLFSGFISCLGITIIGNFQETNLLVVHMLGALLTFGNGILYLAIQARITLSLKPMYNKNPNYWIGPRILYLRAITTLIFAGFYGLVIIFGFLAIIQFEGPLATMPWWTKEHKGYNEHLVATISEWLMVAVFFINLYSFTYEFKSLEYKEVTFKTKPVLPPKSNNEQVA